MTIDQFTERLQSVFQQKMNVTLWPHQIEGIHRAIQEEHVAFELPTGEGKTFIVGAVALWYALQGQQVHVTSANTYLVQRDLNWLTPIYDEFGVASIEITNESAPSLMAENPGIIVYGTVHEFAEALLQTNLRYAGENVFHRQVLIFDEADYTLLDGSTLPVIVAMPVPPQTQMIQAAANLVSSWSENAEYTWEMITKVPQLQEAGERAVAEAFGVQNIYSAEGSAWLHRIHQALVAKDGFIKDKNYIVQDNNVILINEYTGRPAMTERFNNGLHQALEAKESVPIGIDYVTRSRMSVAEYVKAYPKRIAFGATLFEDRKIFQSHYGLNVKKLDPKHPSQLNLLPDLLYPTKVEKLGALVQKAQDIYLTRPVLVNALNVEDAKAISHRLGDTPHRLVIPFGQDETALIQSAGEIGIITIITPMSARGTDLPLTDEAARAGGYYLLSLDRAVTVRADKQLTGRIARRGQTGDAQFFLSMEDAWAQTLSPRAHKVVTRLGSQEDHKLHPKLAKFILQWQDRNSNILFERRKRVLIMDSALTPYREFVFAWRESYLQGAPLPIATWLQTEIEKTAYRHSHVDEIEYIDRFHMAMQKIDPHATMPPTQDHYNMEDVVRWYVWGALANYEKRRIPWTREVELQVVLRMIDSVWHKFLLFAESLEDGIWLRSLVQRNPISEYRREIGEEFEIAQDRIQTQTLYYLMRNKIEARNNQGDLVSQS